MNTRKKRFYAADFLLTAAITAVLAYGLCQTLVVYYEAGDIFWPVLILTAVLSLFFAYPIIAAFAGGLAGLLALSLLFEDGREQLVDFFADFVYWSMNWSPDPLFDGLTLWGIVLAVLFPVFLLIRYHAPTPILIVTGVVLFYGLEILGADTPIPLLLLFFILVLLQMVYNEHGVKKGAGLYLLCTLPFCALIVFLAGRVEPQSEGLGRDVMELFAAEDGFLRLWHIPTRGTADMTGVGAELGGPYKPQGIDMVALRPDRAWKLNEAPYLRGGIGMSYDGRRWTPPDGAVELRGTETEFTDTLRKVLIPAVHFNYQVYDYGIAELPPAAWLSAWSSVGAAATEPLYDSTVRHLTALSHLYLPYDCYSVRYTADDDLFLLDKARIFSENPLSDDTEYTVRTLASLPDIFTRQWERDLPKGGQNRELNLRDAYVEAARKRQPGLMDWLVENADLNGMRPAITFRLPDGRYESFPMQLENAVEEGALYALYSEWAAEGEHAFREYLQIPDSLPDRVGELAASLSVYGNDYDNAVALEKHLSGSYAYQTDMEQTPEGEDFVDYFLFEQKEGYCTYFASAMVILCRSVGIPARYVDGFAPADTKEGGEFIYSDERAHAWAEAYIGGYGWVAFEPTSGFSSSHSLPPPPSKPAPSPSPTPAPSPTPEQTPRPSPTPKQNKAPAPTPEAPKDEAGEDGEPMPFYVILLLLLAAAVMVLTALHLSLRMRRRRFMDSLERVPYDRAMVRRLRKHIEFLLRLVKLSARPHETLGELAVRAQQAWPLEGDKMRRLFALFGREGFSNDAFTEMESYELMELTLELERFASVYIGGIRYWWYHRIIRIL